MVYTSVITEAYFKEIQGIKLPDKVENNEWLVLHKYGGPAEGVPSKFNVKVYRNTRGVLKMVTTDRQTLEAILKFDLLG